MPRLPQIKKEREFAPEAIATTVASCGGPKHERHLTARTLYYNEAAGYGRTSGPEADVLCFSFACSVVRSSSSIHTRESVWPERRRIFMGSRTKAAAGSEWRG